MVNGLLRDLQLVRVYIDDVAIGSTNIQEQQEHISWVFEQIQNSNVKVKLWKFVFVSTNVDILGYDINKKKMEADLNKMRYVTEINIPKLNNKPRLF